MREMLVQFSHQQGLPEVGSVSAEDYMDDGSPIRLTVTIDRRNGSAVFDFTGMAFSLLVKPCLQAILNSVDSVDILQTRDGSSMVRNL